MEGLEPLHEGESTPLHAAVFRKIRNAIISGHLKPGQRLYEQELADTLRVSRTPVREALRKLELEGLVSNIPYRGVFIRVIPPTEALDIFSIREAIEPLAAREAAKKAGKRDISDLMDMIRRSEEKALLGTPLDMMLLNAELHQCIARITGNRYLIDILDNISAYVSILRVSVIDIPGRRNQIIREHREIVDAIARGEPETAREKSLTHIVRAQEVIMRQLRKQ